MDRLGLDQARARLRRRLIVERAVALGARVLRRILGIDAVDVLQQPHPLRAQPGGEEDGGEIGAAAAEGDHAMLLMAGGEARDDDHVMILELRVHRIGVEPAQVRIERIALGLELHLVGIEGAGPDPHPAERERHQRGRAQLADPGEPRDQRRRRVAADQRRLLEQEIGLAGEGGDDGDDLLAVADVAIDLLGCGPIVGFMLEHRASELEDAQLRLSWHWYKRPT